MNELVRLPITQLSPEQAEEVETERARVRAFLREAAEAGIFTPTCDCWLGGFSPEFSRELGARGWIGMTWPRRYGGGERSNVVRQAVIEELLAAGAPVAAHWFADRQIGPSLLRHGTPAQQQAFLPRMASGELYVAVGMSEPDSGSDLASVRTRATRVPGGWRVSGTKVWTSHAHRSHYMLALVRTSPPDPTDRHAGLSQFLIDLAAPGVRVSPILLLDGAHHFNEVVLDDVFVPDEMVVGEVGRGWEQVTAELAHERSGPERYLSTMPLLAEMARELDGGEPAAQASLGRIYARLWTLRQASTAIAQAIDAGRVPAVTAALVKDAGTRLENDIIDEARRLRPSEPALDATDRYDRMLAQAQLRAPGFTLRGGTSEILRGIVARALGMR